MKFCKWSKCGKALSDDGYGYHRSYCNPKHRRKAREERDRKRYWSDKVFRKKLQIKALNYYRWSPPPTQMRMA